MKNQQAVWNFPFMQKPRGAMGLVPSAIRAGEIPVSKCVAITCPLPAPGISHDELLIEALLSVLRIHAASLCHLGSVQYTPFSNMKASSQVMNAQANFFGKRLV